MRKSVILIISTLSLLAIILIGLIFQKAEIYDATIYVESVIIKSIRIGDDYYETFFIEEENSYRVKDPSKENNVQFPIPYHKELTLDIIAEVRPFTASEQGVSFHTDRYDDIERQIATVERDSGRVTFLQDGTATFDVRAVDNAATKTKIKIRTRDLSTP